MPLHKSVSLSRFRFHDNAELKTSVFPHPNRETRSGTGALVSTPMVRFMGSYSGTFSLYEVQDSFDPPLKHKFIDKCQAEATGYTWLFVQSLSPRR